MSAKTLFKWGIKKKQWPKICWLIQGEIWIVRYGFFNSMMLILIYVSCIYVKKMFILILIKLHNCYQVEYFAALPSYQLETKIDVVGFNGLGRDLVRPCSFCLCMDSLIWWRHKVAFKTTTWCGLSFKR